MKDSALSAFVASFRGRIIRPGDAEYDTARALYNGMIDKRPLAILRPTDAADVAAAVAFGRDQGLPIAIRGGGHSGPGFGSCNDGLCIDLSAFKKIQVDPDARTVRVGAGCTAGEVDRATHPFGLAVPFGIVARTGVAGLTLGGGTGYLTRRYGLTLDNLLEAEVVLADGRIVAANETSEPDLFWAIRGGGGNFGVVTSFLFRAHPVSVVFGGPVFWEGKHARTVMRAYRDFLPGTPEDLGIFVGLKRVPATDPFPREHWGQFACAVIGCYVGDAEEGRRQMAPLLDALPEPMFDWRSEMPYPSLQSMFDPLMPAGLQWYWKGDFVRSLPDAAIDVHIGQWGEAAGELSLMHLYPIDGAVHRVAPDATAWSTRDAAFSMVIVGVSADPAQADALKTWGRRYWNAIHPFNLQGGYLNFMMDDEEGDRVRATFGPNYRRLAAVKAVYDPANLFRVNQNIEPEATMTRGA
ncbi:MAG TPA: FAD-binding oxidoreductase [Vicinamibacterales bacterium]